ncbi:MAG: phosphoribosylamine--glycine ligase [Candidatus Tokpelaia sp. JSC085]|nr:MAG: phosphoribosylamine--glycine ligase [Candidatus Tokpelaia sp. JSC085]
MNVVLIGSGGREHALAWKMSTSPFLRKLYCIPGNPGIAEIAENISLNICDHTAVISFCQKHRIDLVMIGPERPLVDGLADSLRQAHILVVGPDSAAARLESSKGFSKDLCNRFTIPIGAYSRFSNAAAAKSYIRAYGAPIVVKADGLAAGKGVFVATTLKEALTAVDACFEGALGYTATEIVVEEFLQGEEISFFCLCDGKIAIPLGVARDHKRVGDGDTGPNTGGMGAYSSPSIITLDMTTRIMRELIEPTLQAMIEIGSPFHGILFAGLMITDSGPKLIEYNVRFGDPECQVLMMRLKNDIVPLLVAAAEGNLAGCKPEWSDDVSLTVVLAAKGYPGKLLFPGSVIDGIIEAAAAPHVRVFHAGTALKYGKIIAAGGRVLNVTACGKTVLEAQSKAYNAIEKIHYPSGFWRSDIGWMEIEREKKI